MTVAMSIAYNLTLISVE